MAMSERGRALYEEMKAARGFIYPAYELLCEVDPELLENYENLKNHIMKKQGPFHEKYKELFIAVASASRDPSDTEGIKNHLKKALQLGASVPVGVGCQPRPRGRPHAAVVAHRNPKGAAPRSAGGTGANGAGLLRSPRTAGDLRGGRSRRAAVGPLLFPRPPRRRALLDGWDPRRSCRRPGL